MFKIVFKEGNPLPFQEWDIEDGKIVRCSPDPEVSWVGVAVPVNENELFIKPFNVHIAWADGSFTALPIDYVMRLSARNTKEQ